LLIRVNISGGGGGGRALVAGTSASGRRRATLADRPPGSRRLVPNHALSVCGCSTIGRPTLRRSDTSQFTISESTTSRKVAHTRLPSVGFRS